MSYLDSLIRSESGGNWRAQNSEIGAGGKAGHFGRVQFGYARLQDAMNAGAIPHGTTPEMFMASPELQMAAEKWHFADLEKNLAPLVGSVVNGQTLDLGALVAMGHLGGAGGARKYVQTGGKYNPSDSFGTSLADYAGTHGGGLLNVSTSGPTTDGTDTMDRPGGLLGQFKRTEDNVGGLLGMLFKNMSPDRADSIRAALGSLPGIDNQGAVGAAQTRMQGRREAESEDLRYARGLEERQRQEALAAQEQQAAMAAEERQRAVARDWIAANAPDKLSAFDAGVITPAQVYEAANPDNTTDVQTSSMLPDQSGTVMTMRDGSIRVVTVGGEILSGQAAIDYVQTAQDRYTESQRSIYGARATGTNEANIATGGAAAEAVRTGTLTADAALGPTIARDTARAAEEGRLAATSASEVAEMQRNLPGLLVVVDELNELADTATYTMGGQARDEIRKQLGAEPGEGAVARAKYIAVVDNQVLPLLRQTFGAAFTVKEGETLRATLGDPNKSPAEKKAVMSAFIEQKKRDLLARGGVVPEYVPPPTGGATGGASDDGIPTFNPQTRQWE